MFRKCLFALPALISPIAIISCSWNRSDNQTKLETILNKGEDRFIPFINKTIKVKKIDVSKLEKRNVPNYSGNISRQFGADLVVGGYKEGRFIYQNVHAKSKKQKFFHAGDDIFLNYGTTVLSPFKGKIVGAFWGRRSDNAIGLGLGGQIILRVNLDDISTKYLTVKNRKKYFNHESFVYITISHLSKNTIKNLTKNKPIKEMKVPYGKFKYNLLINKNITFKNPIEVKQFSPIGIVGSFAENGGWIPHIHVEVHKAGYIHQGDKRATYKFDYIYKNKARQSKGWETRAIGYIPTLKKKKFWLLKSYGSLIKSKKKSLDDLYSMFGLVNPNILFHLYDKNTPVVTAE